MPLDEVGPSKGSRASAFFNAVVEEKGDLAMNHPHFIEVVAPPVADRRIRAGCEWLEEEVVDYPIKNGGIGEYSPISSIVVC